MYATQRKNFKKYITCVAMLVCATFTEQPKAADLYKITVDHTPLLVEIAQTPQAQRRGLQHRLSLPSNHGMLFVFMTPREICMWMRDVPIDLDVAFFNEQLQLVNIRSMKRLTDERHCSQGPISYALEVNRDWFKRNGIKKGALLHFE